MKRVFFSIVIRRHRGGMFCLLVGVVIELAAYKHDI